MRFRERVRVGAVAATAALLAVWAAAVGPGVLHAGATFGVGCPAMTVTGVSASSSGRQHGPVGTTVTISGSNFDVNDYALCNPTLTVSIGGTSFTVDPTQNGSSASSISFALSARANGLVAVASSGTVGANTATSSLDFATDPSVGNLAPAAPTVGQSMSASGTGVNLGGLATGASVSWATIHGSCPSTGASLSASSVSVPAFGSYCNGSATLTITYTANSGGGTQSLTVPLGTVDVAATVSGSAPAEAPAGSAVTVHGSGFGGSGSARVGGVPAGSQWTDTAVTVVLPDAGVGGAIGLTRADGAAIGGGSVTEDARIDTVAPQPATPGSTVTVTGGGFGPQGGTLSLGGAAIPVASWSPTAVSFVVPIGSGSGSVIVSPSSGAAASHRFAIQAVLGGITPSHGPTGTLFQISGAGFGAAQGSVSVGGTAATVSLWGDSSIVARIPAGLAPGGTTITVTAPGQNPVGVHFTIDAPPPSPTSSPGGGTGGSSGSSSSSSSKAPATPAPPSFIAPSANGPIVTTAPVPFQKAPQPTGPVSLTLSSSADSADPGKDVTLDVALVAFGKPVAGSQVDFLLVVEPGRDAALNPTEAITDASGHAKSVLHLSTVAGDTIVLARSGQYSDEVRVVAGSADAGPVAAIGGAGRGTDVISTITSGPSRLILVSALCLCLVLFLAGFSIQVLLPEARRRALLAASVTGGTVAMPSSAGARVVGKLVDGGAAIAALTQYVIVLALTAVLLPPARLLRLVRRLGRRRGR